MKKWCVGISEIPLNREQSRVSPKKKMNKINENEIELFAIEFFEKPWF